MEQDGHVRREESVGAKMVVGMAAERLAAVAAVARSWKPRVERVATIRGVLAEGGSDGATAPEEEAVEMKAPIKMKDSSTVAVAISQIFLRFSWFDEKERERERAREFNQVNWRLFAAIEKWEFVGF